MNMLLGDEATNAITEKIIGCAFRVRDKLKCGFLEKVYENAMVIELTNAGLRVRQQAPVPVYYDGIIVGDYVADLIVEDAVIVELKAVRSIDQIHVAQCLNYLAATGKQICLLLNFWTRVQIKRYLGEEDQAKSDEKTAADILNGSSGNAGA
jgi:GxxExxY protein